MKTAEAASKLVALIQHEDTGQSALDKSICIISCFSVMIGVTLYLLWFLIRNGLPDSASEQVDLEDPENAQP